MEIGLTHFIIAIVTTNKDAVSSGSSPIFYAKDEEHLNTICLRISKVVRGMVHEVDSGTKLVIKQ